MIQVCLYHFWLIVVITNRENAMVRRMELQGIANSLNGSFISRNNDFRGYWSIGQLKLFTNNSGNDRVEFSLPTKQAFAHAELLNSVEQHYTRILEKLLNKQKVPLLWVKEVNIVLDFSPIVKTSQLAECVTSGDPFRCECQIIDDKGRTYSSVHYGRCQPHSTRREIRSTR